LTTFLIIYVYHLIIYARLPFLIFSSYNKLAGKNKCLQLERPVGLDGSAAGVPETKIKFEI